MEQKTSHSNSAAVEGRRKSKINVSRVVAGGVLAGVLHAAADFAGMNYLLASDWQLVAQRININPELIGGTGILPLLHMTAANIVIGLLILTTYAGIRPRFGAGPATAAIASFLIVLPCVVIYAGFGGWLLHWSMVFRQMIVMLCSFTLAGIAGAWIYSEEEQE